MKKARCIIKLNGETYYTAFTDSTTEKSTKEEFLAFFEKTAESKTNYFQTELVDGSTLFLTGENFQKAVFIIEESAE